MRLSSLRAQTVSVPGGRQQGCLADGRQPTWNRILTRSKGAMLVLDSAPARPPASSSCAAAGLGRLVISVPTAAGLRQAPWPAGAAAAAGAAPSRRAKRPPSQLPHPQHVIMVQRATISLPGNQLQAFPGCKAGRAALKRRRQPSGPATSPWRAAWRRCWLAHAAPQDIEIGPPTGPPPQPHQRPRRHGRQAQGRGERLGQRQAAPSRLVRQFPHLSPLACGAESLCAHRCAPVSASQAGHTAAQ